MSEELPPIWALDKAANLAGWDCYAATPKAHVRDSIIAHARTLAKYEQPPADPDEEALVRIFNASWTISNNLRDRPWWPAALAQFKLELNRSKT